MRRLRRDTRCGSPACNKRLVMLLAIQHYHTPQAGLCLQGIISVEDPLWLADGPGTDNPTSQAGGLPQANPKSKMASAGPDWNTDPATQIRWMEGYTDSRYGGPCPALSFRLANGSY